MVKMGTVWDRTSEVLSGRGGMLAGIAGLTLFLPTIVRDGIAYALGGGNPAAPLAPGLAALVGLIGLAVALIMIFGQLALIASASDPATGRGEALRIAGARILPAIGILLVLGVIFFVLALPFLLILGGAGVDMAQIQAGKITLPPGTAGALTLYFAIFVIVMIWLSARLAVLLPVIANERLGLRSYPRAWALTRGMTWRIVGTLILFGIVAVVAIMAAQMVAGVVFRVVLGADRIALALFLAGIVVAAVSAAATVVYTTFTAQLYVARSGQHAGTATL